MSLESITQQFFEASQQRRACRVKLKSDPAERTIHPYGICRTSRDKITVVCLQVDGFSGSAKLPSYKNLSLEDCEWVEPIDLRFIVQSNFNPDDPHYKDWVYHV